jgi:hypothetical protein
LALAPMSAQAQRYYFRDDIRARVEQLRARADERASRARERAAEARTRARERSFRSFELRSRVPNIRVAPRVRTRIDTDRFRRMREYRVRW